MLININEIKVNPGRREAAPEDVQRLSESVADPFLETRERQDAFLGEIKNTIRESLHTSGAGLGGLATLLQSAQPTPRPDEMMSEEAFDTAMDFINGL